MAELGTVVALIKSMSGADPAVIEEAVQDWLDDHPEATTTVQDGSITEAKLAQDVLAELGEIDELKEAIENKAGLKGGTAIESGTDLNNIKTPGTYVAATSVLSSLSHCPATISFRMFVMQTTNTNDDRVQIIFENDGSIYHRAFRSNSWKSWEDYKSYADAVVAENFSNAALLKTGTTLSANADLNSITTSGSYNVGGATTATIKNAPTTYSFRLFVLQTTNGNDGRNQIVIDVNGDIYRRTYASSTWSPWIKLSKEMNPEETQQIYATANYGVAGSDGTPNKRRNFSMLILADIHKSEDVFKKALQRITDDPAILCGISLGDMQVSNYSENDGTWYTGEVSKLTKPFFTVIGNHDGGNNKDHTKSGTKAQVFAKFIQPTLTQIGLPNLTKTYYRKDFSDYKLTLIVLDNYDAPDTTDNNDDFIVSRGAECFSQDQIDWFIGELATIPSDYHLLIARHSGAGTTWTVDTSSDWTNPNNPIIESATMVYSTLPINDIVQAWRTGGTLVQTYAPTTLSDTLPTISVNADFSSRGTGVFAGYIVGHHHGDVVAQDANGQKILQFDTTSISTYMTFRSDLPRVAGTSCEECITLIGVNTTDRIVKFTRIGSRMTTNLRKRETLTWSY